MSCGGYGFLLNTRLSSPGDYPTGLCYLLEDFAGREQHAFVPSGAPDPFGLFPLAYQGASFKVRASPTAAPWRTCRHRCLALNSLRVLRTGTGLCLGQAVHTGPCVKQLLQPQRCTARSLRG